MKLLFVHERGGPFAGVEANLCAMVRELNRRGHAAGIVHGPATCGIDTSWDETFQQEFPLDQCGNASGLLAILEQFQPDAVCVQSVADLEVLEALVASGVPTVRMVLDHNLGSARSPRNPGFTRCIHERLASPFCASPRDAFEARHRKGRFSSKGPGCSTKVREVELNRRLACMIVATQFVKEELQRNGFDAERIEILPPVPRAGNPVHGSSFCRRNIVLHAGQIIRRSRVDVLIESLAQVRVPFECFIFGDGNHRAFCERLTHQLGVTDRVHFKGCVPPAEIDIYYRESSAVAVTSVWSDPLGTAGLEGMRYGLPVVAFDTGGVNEWLINGYNGYRVPSMDRTAFATRVEALLRDKALGRRMGCHGQRMVAEYYGFSTYIDRLEALFARVATRPAASSLAL